MSDTTETDLAHGEPDHQHVDLLPSPAPAPSWNIVTFGPVPLPAPAASPPPRPVVPRTVALPSPDCDVLTGVRQIAAWRGITTAAAKSAIASGEIPAHRIRGRVIGFKDEIVAALRDQAARGGTAASRNPSGKAKDRA